MAWPQIGCGLAERSRPRPRNKQKLRKKKHINIVFLFNCDLRLYRQYSCLDCFSQLNSCFGCFSRFGHVFFPRQVSNRICKDFDDQLFSPPLSEVKLKALRQAEKMPSNCSISFLGYRFVFMKGNERGETCKMCEKP